MYKYWLKEIGNPETYCPVEFKKGGASVITGLNVMGGLKPEEVLLGEFWYDDNGLNIRFNEEGERIYKEAECDSGK